MNGIIIYESKYGATGQYVQWLSESLKMPSLKAKDATAASLKGHDLIILGSPVYVGKLRIRKWLKRNMGLLQHKKLFLFIVSGTPEADQAQQQTLIENNIDPAIRGNLNISFLPGRCIVSKLSWLDRIILKMGAMREKDEKKKAGMMAGFDGVDRKNLDELIKKVAGAGNG